MARALLPLLILLSLYGWASQAHASESQSPDDWQERDWQGLPDSSRIGQQTVLYARHDSARYLGLAILLPEWQQSGQLWQQIRTLTGIGFDTLLLLPSPRQSELDPATEKKQQSTDEFRHQFAERITRLSEAKRQEGGVTLMLAQGTGAAWAVSLIDSEQIAAPDALVLLDGGFSNAQCNEILAKQIARIGMPILALYREEGAGWPLLAAKARQSESRRSHKQNYRPYALITQDETPARIRGWLGRLGWI